MKSYVVPTYDSWSESTQKISFETEAASPHRMPYMFSAKHVERKLLSMCMPMIGLTWQEGFNIYKENNC